MKVSELFETDYIAQNARRNSQMAAAQSRYDNMNPPEDHYDDEENDVECSACDGTGQLPDESDEEGERTIPCPMCEGHGRRPPTYQEIQKMRSDSEDDYYADQDY